MPANRTLNKLRIRRTETMVTILGIPDVPGTAATIFKALGDEGIPLTMIVQNAPDAGSASITFSVDRTFREKTIDIVGALGARMGAEGFMDDEKIARLSVVGDGLLEDTPGLAGRFFSALAGEGINILAINSTADIISCIIEDAAVDRAAKVICRKFNLKPEIVE
jgi:aspartate kinase